MYKIQKLAAFTMLLCVLSCAVFTTGCSNTGKKVSKTSVYQGDDALYRAEKAIVTSHNEFKRFLQWELKYRQILPVEVSRTADFIRLNEKKWIDAANAARDAYVATPGDAAKKDTLLAVVNLISTALDQALLFQTTNEAKAPPGELRVTAFSKL